MTGSPEIRRARDSFWWVGVIVPIAMLGVSMLLVLARWTELPDPVAMHWSGAEPDGFGPKATILAPALLGIGLIASFAALAPFAHRLPPQMLSGGGGVITDAAGAPQWSLTARFLGAVSMGLAGLMGLMTVGTAIVQRGIADARDAGDIGPWALGGFGLLVALTVVGWFLQPRVASAPGQPAAPDAESVASAQSVEWSGTVSIARSGRADDARGCGSGRPDPATSDPLTDAAAPATLEE